jgi:hypothetical protein
VSARGAALIAALLAACGGADPTVTITPRVPDDPVLFDDIDGFSFSVEHGGTTLELARFPGNANVMTLPPVQLDTGYVYVLEGYLGETLVARGRTCAVDLVAGEAPSVPLYFSRVAVFFDTGAPAVAPAAPLLHERGGDVLLVGEGAVQLYRTATGDFADHGRLPAACPVAGARLAPLTDGDALLVGGALGDGTPAIAACAYRRARDTFVELRGGTADVRLDRAGHTLTALGGGRALLVGNRLVDGTLTRDADAAWLYDDADGSWTRLASLAAPRSDHAAVATSTTNAGAMVMLLGGRAAADGPALGSIEIFNPTRGQFTVFPGALATARLTPSATYVPGQDLVVVAGGTDGAGVALDAVEAVVPYSVLAAESLSPAGTAAERTGRAGHTATLLADGRVLITGGRDAGGAAVDTTLLFDPDPTALRFQPGGALRHARAGHAAIGLCDETVLVAGGTADAGAVGAAEVYNPGD